MFLVTLASGRRRPWLRQYRFISDETLSSDERWVLFSVHRAWDDDLNAVYLAGADGSAPRRVLRPLAESRTYGRCVLRPRP